MIAKKKCCVYACAIFITFACGSCSSTQRITVKQTQADQVQETQIESNTQIRELSLNFCTYL